MAGTKTSMRFASAGKTGVKAKTAKGSDQRLQQARRASILCAQLSQSQPAVSHHLALLRHGGIIAPRRQGKNNFYSLTDTGAALADVVKGLIA
jgi:ArsR family transcriptional regulator, zinc-responsive transcriptional repressor